VLSVSCGGGITNYLVCGVWYGFWVSEAESPKSSNVQALTGSLLAVSPSSHAMSQSPCYDLLPSLTLWLPMHGSKIATAWPQGSGHDECTSLHMDTIETKMCDEQMALTRSLLSTSRGVQEATRSGERMATISTLASAGAQSVLGPQWTSPLFGPPRQQACRQPKVSIQACMVSLVPFLLSSRSFFRSELGVSYTFSFLNLLTTCSFFDKKWTPHRNNQNKSLWFLFFLQQLQFTSSESWNISSPDETEQNKPNKLNTQL
jgi:hypothetical protein